MSYSDAAKHRGALAVMFVLAAVGAFVSDGWPRLIFALIIVCPVALWLDPDTSSSGPLEDQQHGDDHLHGERETEGTVGHDRGHGSAIGIGGRFLDPEPPRLLDRERRP